MVSVAFHDFKEVTPRQCSLNHISPATRFVMTKSDRSGVSVTSGPQQQQQWLHGIMGTPMPNKLPYLWPCLESKYTTYDHARTANTIPTWWLVSWDLMRPIGGELVTTITSPSCWGTHFLYPSNPPSGNLLPIIPCIYLSERFNSQPKANWKRPRTW